LSNAATNLETTQHTVRRGSVFMLRKVEPTKLEAKLMNRAYTLHIEDQFHHVRSRSTSSGLAKSTAHIMTSVKKKRNRGVEFPGLSSILEHKGISSATLNY